MYVSLQTEEHWDVEPIERAPKSKAPVWRTLAKDAHLYREGDTADLIFEVETGVLRLTRVMENGRRQVIAFGYPGDVVGFPSGSLYHTDCNALTPATLIAHKRAALESEIGDAQLHKRLLEAALREISAMQDHFLMLGRKSASERVASFLVTLQNRVGVPLGEYEQFNLPMGRSDIADFLGLTTETVSRAITQLRKSKVIALHQIHTVVVLRTDALRALADTSA
jgi:CRP-like cAMP-binding protein